MNTLIDFLSGSRIKVYLELYKEGLIEEDSLLQIVLFDVLAYFVLQIVLILTVISIWKWLKSKTQLNVAEKNFKTKETAFMQPRFSAVKPNKYRGVSEDELKKVPFVDNQD